MPRKAKDDYEASDSSDDSDGDSRSIELRSEEDDDSDSESDGDDEEDEDNDDEEDDDENEEDIDVPVSDDLQTKNQPKFDNSDYHSPFSNILSINEKTAIIGLYAQWIASGSDIYVETYVNDTPFSIARRSLIEKKIPFYLNRQLPNGEFIAVKLDDLLDVNP